MLYMVTFTINIYQYTPNVSMYTSTMDPMGNRKLFFWFHLVDLGVDETIATSSIPRHPRGIWMFTKVPGK